MSKTINASTLKYWLIIPAAGTGQRMQSCTPKQYLKLAGKTILEHTLSVFEPMNQFAQVQLVLSPTDAIWDKLNVQSKLTINRVDGGAQRYDSVNNAVMDLDGKAHADDWVFVHDAARPCVSPTEIKSLIEALQTHPVGGLLGVPVRDTLKYVNSIHECERTVDRSNLYHALTPQVFRYAILRKALAHALSTQLEITDESSAVEALGLKPKMVLGQATNLKITTPEDLAFAELILKERARMGLDV